MDATGAVTIETKQQEETVTRVRSWWQNKIVRPTVIATAAVAATLVAVALVKSETEVENTVNEEM